MDPTEVTVDLKAEKTILAMVEAHDARGGLANVTLDVGASPANLQARTSFDDVPVKLDGKFGPLDLSRLPIVVGEGRLARRLRGTAGGHRAGPRVAPGADAGRRGPDGAARRGSDSARKGRGEARLPRGPGPARRRAGLGERGVLERRRAGDFDVSFPAIRRGLKPTSAPFQATVTARKFDLAFLTGFNTTLRKVAGTLDIDAKATGTAASPQAQGKVEWKDGILGLSGFGEYQRVHLLLNASNDRVSLDDLEAHTESGTLKLTALGTRDGPVWTLKANGEATDFPVFAEDQMVATLSLRTNLDGTARRGHVEIDRIHIPEAHVTLPTQSRRDLQSLSRPDDIILLRNGKPVDPKRARKVLAKDRAAEAALGGSGELQEETRATSIVLVLDAPKNLWVKGQDLNVEVGLSPDFRVEVGEETDLFGEVRVLRGRLDVLGRRFDFQKDSVVRFTGPPAEPALNVTAVYNNVKAGVKVSMHVQGEAGDVQLVPTSEPPLTESESTPCSPPAGPTSSAGAAARRSARPRRSRCSARWLHRS